MPFATDPESNLAILEAMVDELEAYLESDDLFRQLVVQTDDKTYQPKMTLGLAIDHIETLKRDISTLRPADRLRLEDAAKRYADVRGERFDPYAAKLRREMKSHLDSWTWFLDRCAEGDETCQDDYESEVWLRTRLEGLMREARSGGIAAEAEEARLSEQDRRLDDMFRSGTYVGPREQEAEYPKPTFWWLYGKPMI